MLNGLADVFGSPSGPSLFLEGEAGQSLNRTNIYNAIADKPKIVWANAKKEVPKSFLGLVRLSLPRMSDKCLCMASIAIKVENGDDRSVANLKLYGQLRTALRRRLRA